MTTSPLRQPMQITVELFASFRKDRFKRETWERPAPFTVLDVATELGLAAEELGIVLVNARHATTDRLLEDGDKCCLYPQVGGG